MSIASHTCIKTISRPSSTTRGSRGSLSAPSMAISSPATAATTTAQSKGRTTRLGGDRYRRQTSGAETWMPRRSKRSERVSVGRRRLRDAGLGIVTAAGNGGGGGGDRPTGDGPDELQSEGGEETKKSVKQNNINITGMGSRYANVPIGEVSDLALTVNVLLAVASLVAVVYLVFTAPSKDSPQFARDGVEFVKLGIVEEAELGEGVA